MSTWTLIQKVHRFEVAIHWAAAAGSAPHTLSEPSWNFEALSTVIIITHHTIVFAIGRGLLRLRHPSLDPEPMFSIIHGHQPPDRHRAIPANCLM